MSGHWVIVISGDVTFREKEGRRKTRVHVGEYKRICLGTFGVSLHEEEDISAALGLHSWKLQQELLEEQPSPEHCGLTQ